MSFTENHTHSRWDGISFVLGLLRRMLADAQAAARGIRSTRYAKLHRYSSVAELLICTLLITAAVVAFNHVYLDRTNLPDLEPFVRFDFPTIGHVYDIHDQPLMEMASEYRWISKYENVPPVVCGAILAAEDKNFFSHPGSTILEFLAC